MKPLGPIRMWQLLLLITTVPASAQLIPSAGEPFENIKAKAEQGEARAQYQLGKCYAQGAGVSKDAVEAMKWYRKAADQGHSQARQIVEAGTAK